jgi:FkbM family methyltransferase
MTNHSEPGRTIIYDFGSNNGDDIPYYLLKADLVVAVEANPALAKQIQSRFAREIHDGRLAVENCVLTADVGAPAVSFYVNHSEHVLSQFPRPTEMEGFTEVSLPARSVVDVIAAYGQPTYVKIDIEHYDEAILEALFAHDIRPPFISAESHSIEVFALMVTAGRYRSFNLVDGRSVSTRYRRHAIRSRDGEQPYSFPYDSAGPFGEDIIGSWMTPDNFFVHLASEGLGWKDIHATTEIEPDPAFPALQFRPRGVEPDRHLIHGLKQLVPPRLYPVVRRLKGRWLQRQ